MPEGHVFLAMSLDGFIATKKHGLKWLDVVDRKGEDYGYAKFFKTVDALVMGGNTYRVVRGFNVPWPYKGKKVFIWTRRPIKKPLADEQAVKGSLKTIFRSLGRQGIKRVYLDGGITIRQGLREGVVTRLTIAVIPVLLGDGISLFQGLGRKVSLKVISVKNFGSGLVQVKYQVGS